VVIFILVCSRLRSFAVISILVCGRLWSFAVFRQTDCSTSSFAVVGKMGVVY